MRVTVFGMDRLKNSRNGNPKYRVYTSEGTYITSSDHEFVFRILNGWEGKTSREAEISLTRAGYINGLEYRQEGTA